MPQTPATCRSVRCVGGNVSCADTKDPLHGVLVHYRRGIFNSNASRVFISRHRTPNNVQAARIKLSDDVYTKNPKNSKLVLDKRQKNRVVGPQITTCISLMQLKLM